MIVQLSPAEPAQLTDLDRLDRLHAVCPGDIADMQLAPWCAADGDHLWLDVAGCRAIGVAAQGDGWGAHFDAMIEYAGSKGWTDAAGARVRAHIEFTATPYDPTDGTDR